MKLIPVVLSVALFSGLVQGAEAPVQEWESVRHNTIFVHGQSKVNNEYVQLGVFLNPNTCELDALALMVDVRYDMEEAAEMLGMSPEEMYKMAETADGSKARVSVEDAVNPRENLVGSVLVSDPFVGTVFGSESRSFRILNQYMLKGKTIYFTKNGEGEAQYRVNPTGYPQALKSIYQSCQAHIAANPAASVPSTGQVM